MDSPCFLLRLVFAVLSLLLALRSSAYPATPNNPDSLVLVNASVEAVINHCYTPFGEETPGIQPTSVQSCNDALMVLVQTPDFMANFRFSRNPRASAKRLPLGWQLNEDVGCRIVVNCENDRDTAVFRYADVAQAARRTIRACVDNPDPFGRVPLLKWGGVARLKEEETFYVAVAQSLPPGLEIEMANRTVFAGGVLVDGGTESS